MDSNLTETRLTEGMIDSHTHLFHMKSKGMDHLGIIRHCFANGLSCVVDIGINPENFSERVRTAKEIPSLYTAHGYYPSACTRNDLDELLVLLENTLKTDDKAVAVGETGLDFHHDYGAPELQAELAVRQIEIADRLGKPVIIHSRNAEEETLKLLSEHTPENGGIIHCYSYSAETAAKFIELGFYISFAGNVTYKNASEIQQAAASVPLDRILVETDAPYLSPQAVRGRDNHSGYIGYTYEHITRLKGIELEELILSVARNFRRLFRISHPEL